ncbi:peptide/nickel transport system permease protein [Marinactinospora thermotolerans DSM 45154]|uniref:Oligopeptide transport system permease protein OppC n=1 Tax=Marinactinospora thermotolerans DSM 45154 TaxID=1122192 RepID=A0A1T4RQJ2_9ACTN|nr:ABC transporter permease [Marinactinospora thermotolerans]SKA17901.1 peptide/nickel transport system permease protein [Marinactinospora thermotolerans DSM 45154]
MSMSTERVAGETGAGHEGGTDEVRIPGRWSTVLRTMLRQRRVVVGIVVLLLLTAAAWIGPAISPWTFEERDYANFLQPPSPEHWLGTDNTGRDVFTITMVGLQKSIIIGLLVAVISTLVAAVVGSFAGYFLGVTDKALMWITDLALVLPSFLILAILFPWIRGSNWLLFVLLLAAFMWMITAKMVRGMTISLKEREYVLAARYMGVPAWKIIFRHILPNMSSLLIVDATMNVSSAIIAETSLSYFGFGVQPPDVSLGSLIAIGARQAITHPWTFVFCTGLLVVLVLAVNLIGDGLRDALDPQSKSRRA